MFSARNKHKSVPVAPVADDKENVSPVPSQVFKAIRKTGQFHPSYAFSMMILFKPSEDKQNASQSKPSDVSFVVAHDWLNSPH